MLCTSKLLEFKEFNKTITPFVLVGYETGYSQLGAMRLVSYPTRAHGIIFNYSETCVILKLGRRAMGHLVTLIEINVHLIRGINISERGLGWRDVKACRIIRCIFSVIKCREVSSIPSPHWIV